ncbi:MAG: maltose alpha-D-glucosyltransferase [Thiobacillaceae bacterium]
MREQDPLWFKDAVIYELHVKAFFDSNRDGVGDFPGLIAKLDYLQELGVDTLWLLPFYPSPLRDDGYDIADYRGVHPAYGTMSDFRAFMGEANRRGIHVITELILNHTSDQHPWFQAARRAPPGSAKRNYYVWSETDTRYAGTRVIFSDSETSNWSWDQTANAYYWHRFFSHQPDLNFANPHVIKAMMRVMRFWFDAGVDGLRLDAVPYLCEREGTNNENLPETHAVIKRMRAELDQRYSGRVFLAEANQWPEDVRDYFGEGDECHMAYHFPLMPRMYMAIAQEDRHPITEIMQQTPDIPDNCQWVTFLRNHDELTLEMVTDRERDYLYQAYAMDPQARLNLGIRRRLAPLMNNERLKIELMNLLLMTLPGSSGIYYGDEIGMGDNLRLGDRNGVRTPMQWSGAANGGFSNAQTGKLYLPVIDDPEFGYGAVNVEAQSRNPSSLLQWTRRLIAMRKANPAFGRGTLQFLRPGNRKILAFLREYAGESLLCVANLARAPQAVELNLGAFKGRVPVELMGRSRFPPIGELPYLLTLGGYGFYVFRLAADVEAPVWHEERPPPPDLPVLVLDDAGWKNLFTPGSKETETSQLITQKMRGQLEGHIVPHFCRSQAWFLEPGPAVEKFELGVMQEWSTESGNWVFTAVDAVLVKGEIHRYALPLALAWEDEDEGRVVALLHAALAKVRRRARVGILFDALWDDAFCCSLVQGMEQGIRQPIGQGELRFHSTRAFPENPCRTGAPSIVRSVTEKGRLRINVSDQLVLKACRWLLVGIHPELEMSQFLTEVAKFSHIPQLAGTVEYLNEQGLPVTLAILERYTENQGTARDHLVDDLERHLDECRTSPECLPDTRHAGQIRLMTTLGLRTAQFHQALALPDEVGAFGTESVSANDVADWVSQARRRLDLALDLLGMRLPYLPHGIRPTAEALLALRPKLYRRVVRAASIRIEAVKTRCHGDFHLGQVWLAENDFLLANYGGEPGHSWSQRRERDCPLRDIADMLLSISDTASTALDRVAGDSAPVAEQLRPHAAAWETLLGKAFLRSYRKAMVGHALLLPNHATAAVLLKLFLADKALARLHIELERRAGTLDHTLRTLIGIAQDE